MKYEKTKFDGIYTYSNSSGKKYRVRFKRSIDGRKVEKSKSGFTSLAAAKAWKAEEENKVLDGDIEEPHRTPTLEEYWEKYQEMKLKGKAWNKSTAKTSSYRMQIWLRTFGSVRVDKLTKSAIQSEVYSLYEEKDYSEETVKNLVRQLKGLLDECLEDNLIQTNPARKVTYSKPGGWKPKQKVLSMDDLKAFMSAAKEQMRPDLYRCLYMLTYGLRRGEAYALRPEVITPLENGSAAVLINRERTREYPEGKGTKSATSERLVVVDQTGANMLQEQVKAARKIMQRHDRVLNQSDYIFINPDTGKPYYINQLNKAMKEVAEPLGLRVTPHMLRHMFATYASAAGVDSLQLQKYLGHADQEMTSHYTHPSLEGAERVAEMTKGFREKIN